MDYLTSERKKLLQLNAECLVHNRLNEINENMKPRDEKEKEYFNSWVEYWNNNKDKYDDYDERLKKAKLEASKVEEKYMPKEYLKDGYYNSEEYKALEIEISKKVDKILPSKIYKLDTLSKVINLRKYLERKKIKMLSKAIKKQIGIDYVPKKNYITDNYVEEIKNVEKKYGVYLEEFLEG